MASKRFTDILKWDDAWFMELEPGHKLAWIYICDRCDSSGVIDLNKNLADFQVGQRIDWNDFLEKCDGRIVVLDNGKWFILKFIEFQYGELSENCRPHKSIIKQAEKNGLITHINKSKGKHTLSIPLANPIADSGKGTNGTLQDKDKDKDKEKDKDKWANPREKLSESSRSELDRWVRYREGEDRVVGLNDVKMESIYQWFVSNELTKGPEHVSKCVKHSIDRGCRRNVPYDDVWSDKQKPPDDGEKSPSKKRVYTA